MVPNPRLDVRRNPPRDFQYAFMVIIQCTRKYGLVVGDSVA